jgi:hypothetical protein
MMLLTITCRNVVNMKESNRYMIFREVIIELFEMTAGDWRELKKNTYNKNSSYEKAGGH